MQTMLKLFNSVADWDDGRISQVCPAGWKPGESTMKPDPKGKLDYFAAI